MDLGSSACRQWLKRREETGLSRGRRKRELQKEPRTDLRKCLPGWGQGTYKRNKGEPEIAVLRHQRGKDIPSRDGSMV